MLPANLPSWIQDFPGLLKTSTLSQGVGTPLSLLAVFLVFITIALWLVDRLSNADRAAATHDPRGDSINGKRSHMPLRFSSLDALPAAPTAWPTATRLQPATVLVVDDSTLVRAKLGRLLTSAGYRVVEAGDGQRAWELMQQGELPAVMITDLEMPVLDGFELIAAVHGAVETEHVPIIAITGREDLRTRIADLSGIYGIFKKPWNDRELVRRVDALVTISTLTRQAAITSSLANL